jgi:hypothetical protein
MDFRASVVSRVPALWKRAKIFAPVVGGGNYLRIRNVDCIKIDWKNVVATPKFKALQKKMYRKKNFHYL